VFATGPILLLGGLALMFAFGFVLILHPISILGRIAVTYAFLALDALARFNLVAFCCCRATLALLFCSGFLAFIGETAVGLVCCRPAILILSALAHFARAGLLVHLLRGARLLTLGSLIL